MQVQIQKTDTGCVIPVSEDLVLKSKFSLGSTVDIVLENDRFVVANPNDPHYMIEELLEGMTSEHLHDEISMEPPRGNEVW